jgi:hypothetical protein
MELLVLGLVATIGFASYTLWQKARAAAEPPTGGGAGDDAAPLALRVGDVVQHLGTDYLVEGVLTFARDSEVGGAARLYRLVDGTRERYLYLAGSADPVLLEETREVRLEDPASDSLEHAAQHFRCKEAVQAAALRIGAVGESRGSGRVMVRHYAAPGVARLLVLTWSDHSDTFLGERVAPHLIDVLPGK